MGKLIFCTFSGIVLIFMASVALAGWPSNPDSNMVICNQLGDQTTPKIVATSDGGCYITWYDPQTGNYNMTMQRLNGDGEIMWQENGLVISSHPQDSWLTDYGLTVDGSDNAIVVFNDIRAGGGDWDIYAYKISPTGEFLWGPDGLTISANDDGELGPLVTATSDGNVVVGWPRETETPDVFVVELRKLTPDGIDFWQNPSTITLSAEYGLSLPRLAAAENGGVIVQALKAAGPGFYSHKDLYAYKLDASGSFVWGDSGIMVSDTGGFLFHMKPYIAPDGDGGAYSYWYDGRDNQQHVYVQHILNNGTMQWDENGLQASLAYDRLQMEPVLVKLAETNDIMVFYQSTDLGQSVGGVYGQMIDSSGERVWGDTGIALVEIGEQVRYDLNAARQQDGAIITFIETISGSTNWGAVQAIRINRQGNQVWVNSPAVIAATSCVYGYLQSAVNPQGQVISTWVDNRDSYDGNIYLQNVNPDGSFGPYISSIDDGRSNSPDRFTLSGNYPNPFNASTKFNYSLSETGNVRLTIYDLTGRKVKCMQNGMQEAGIYQVAWNGTDASGETVSSGIYFYRFEIGDKSVTKRMVLLK